MFWIIMLILFILIFGFAFLFDRAKGDPDKEFTMLKNTLTSIGVFLLILFVSLPFPFIIKSPLLIIGVLLFVNTVFLKN